VTVVEESYVLTESGWPRPRVNDLPIPWVAPTRNLGEVNEGRRTAGAGGSICQVCGGGFGVGDLAFMLTILPTDWQGPIRPGDTMPELSPDGLDRYQALDGAVLHDRCMKLTRTMCPHVRDRQDLVLVEVPANDADPLWDQDGRLYPTYPATECVIVETTRRP
jgi:hypothetical protein